MLRASFPDFNLVVVSGVVDATPTLTHDGDIALVSFPVNIGGRRARPMHAITISAEGDLATAAHKSLRPGSPVAVEGILRGSLVDIPETETAPALPHIIARRIQALTREARVYDLGVNQNSRPTSAPAEREIPLKIEVISAPAPQAIIRPVSSAVAKASDTRSLTPPSSATTTSAGTSPARDRRYRHGRGPTRGRRPSVAPAESGPMQAEAALVSPTVISKPDATQVIQQAEPVRRAPLRTRPTRRVTTREREAAPTAISTTAQPFTLVETEERFDPFFIERKK